ncbi:hypothetical protein M8C21_000894, partial [Ambrosia artemisiifolia]
MRAGEAYSTYNEYIIKKYGEDTSLLPEIDMDLWSLAAGGKKKGLCVNESSYIELGATERIVELEQDKIEKHAMMEKLEESA